MREWILRLRERQELIRIQHEIDRVSEKYEPELSKLDPRSDEAQYINFTIFEEVQYLYEAIDEIDQRRIMHDAKKFHIRIPSTHENQDYWQTSPDGGVYLSERGKSAAMKEIMLRRYYHANVYTSYAAIVIAALSLAVSIYVALR